MDSQTDEFPLNQSCNGSDLSIEQDAISQHLESTEKVKKPPRSERKRLRHQQLLLEKRDKRKQKKIEQKLRRKEESTDSGENGDRLSKRERCQQIRERLQSGLETGQRICLDLAMEDLMSDKEKVKLALQFGRLYGCNRKAANPAHIYLTGLDKTKSLYRQLCEKNSGFDNYLIDTDERRHTEIFPLSDLVYLSPDSEVVLSEVDPQKVYVLGGLVDEGVKKNITESQAGTDRISTARLPIREYMRKLEQDSHSTVLAVNQVFEILMAYTETNDWKKALAAGVPRRKGFSLDETTELSNS